MNFSLIWLGFKKKSFIMTNVTRLFEFPYYQLEKYNSISDALVTKYNGDWIKNNSQTQRNIEYPNDFHYKVGFGLILSNKRKVFNPLFFPQISYDSMRNKN